MRTVLECAEYFNRDINWTVGGDDTQYYIEKIGDEVIIAFLGSNSKADWKNNFSFWKRPYKDMEIPFYCHGGFLKCWKLVRDEIEQKVLDLNPKYITVTGHSYGGAMATFCIEDMWYLFPELRSKMQCITFGSPRILGLWNYKKIKDRWASQRLFTNGSDIVTCLPFNCMFFRHVKDQIHIGKIRNIFDFFNPIKFHSITGYIDTLKNCN